LWERIELPCKGEKRVKEKMYLCWVEIEEINNVKWWWSNASGWGGGGGGDWDPEWEKRQQKLQVINQIFDIINKINDK
jgi:hypothetical protein